MSTSTPMAGPSRTSMARVATASVACTLALRATRGVTLDTAAPASASPATFRS